jgi:hypothetical protein
MKRVFLLAAGLMIAAAGFSQVSIGFQGTGNITTAKLKFAEGTDFDKKALFSPGGGVVVELGISEHFALRSGLHYQQHQVEATTVGIDPDNGDLGEIKIVAKNKFHYLQLPVYAMYKKDVGVGELFAGVGPFVNYGLSGKSKLTAYYTVEGGGEESETIESDAFKKEEDGGSNFKRVDVGAGALAGLRFKNGLFFNLGYQMGLTNITRDEGNTYKTHSVQLSIGYFIR